jgi:hypothetical protein
VNREFCVRILLKILESIRSEVASFHKNLPNLDRFSSRNVVFFRIPETQQFWALESSWWSRHSKLAQSIKCLTCIPKVFSSTLCRDTENTDWGFSYFLSQNKPRPLPSISFHLIIYYYLTTQCSENYMVESALELRLSQRWLWQVLCLWRNAVQAGESRSTFQRNVPPPSWA